MATFSNNFVAKNGKSGNCEYYCEKCDYKCFKKYNWDKHILTSKHITATKINETATEKWQKWHQFTCEICGKEYKDRTGLWRHKKKCNKPNNIIENKDNNEDNKLVEYLMKENKEIKEMILEIVKNGITNTNTNTNTNHSHNTTNSHNKAFNLQFFLNETCKDAMNITDFVDSITLQLSDLERVGEMGYVEGISNIIIKNLNKLDETKRPVHCTDKKRETIYIKDEGQWEKEDDNKPKLKKAINKIAHKNIKLINEFREKYPECRKSDSHLSDKYNKMIIEAMGGPGDNNTEKTEKIIKNITKVTTISQK
jgi:hypothetical protein